LPPNILLGVAWASLYGLADNLIPGSFMIDGGRSDAAHPPTWKDLVFFSFTTLTTTGYGNSVPVAPHAQSLAILEQLTGTFYVAVLIARLAGLYQPGASKPFVGNWRRWRRQQRDDGAQ
jgi:Ion channel